MEIIKNLPAKIVNGNLVSFAIFKCSFCLREIEKRKSNGLRDKSCGCQKDKLTSVGNKGKPKTEEHKQKIRLANTGRIVSEETKKKIGVKSKGRIVSEETKKKIGVKSKGRKLTEKTKQKIKDNHADLKGGNNPFYGRKHSEESKQKIRENKPDFSGKNNPMYGKTKELCPAWNNGSSFEPYSPEFNKEFKQQILERDNYICQNPECEHLSEGLDCHHIDYDKKNNILENVITLCNSCHGKTNGKNNRQYWTEFYQNIMKGKLTNV